MLFHAEGECDDQEESQGLLAQFIDYIKQRKTVPLEQLATEFKLRTTEVIDRVQGLEAMGRLTGVMDERGKVGGEIVSDLSDVSHVSYWTTKQSQLSLKLTLPFPLLSYSIYTSALRRCRLWQTT